ncbi:MAG: hypothetical protein EOP10_31045 [Proteobacteria bacterium]|nr:MAG: hypothetical protein EOP10_31045 [Pseudomonadota bacterium]
MDDLQSEFLTNEECVALAETMVKKYRIAMKDRTFSIRASVQGKGTYVTILLTNTDGSYYYPVEGRLMHDAEEMSPREAALFLIDYIDTYFEEYLYEEDEQIYLPIDWTDHEYEAFNFQIRGQIVNKKLESLADEWLAKA